MNNLTISNIDTYVTGITYDIASLCILNTIYRIALFPVCCGRVWQAYSKVFVDTHNKAGTIGSFCQAASTIYIRISHKLQSVLCYCLTHL